MPTGTQHQSTQRAKAQEAEDRPKAHKVEQPSKTEAKKGKRDRPKAHNVYHPNGKEPADKRTQPSREQQNQDEKTNSNKAKSLNQPGDHLRSSRHSRHAEKEALLKDKDNTIEKTIVI